MKFVVQWLAPQFQSECEQLAQTNEADKLRRLHTNSDTAQNIWNSWTLPNDGSVIVTTLGGGILEIPPEHLVQLDALKAQVEALLNSVVVIGVGKSTYEAEIAAKVAMERGGNQIALYVPGLEQEVKDEKEETDPLVMRKDEVPATPDFTAAFHSIARDQEVRLARINDATENEIDTMRQQIAVALTAIKAQAPVLGQIKEHAPDLYQAVVDLTAGVVAMARALKDREMGKSEKMTAAFLNNETGEVFQTGAVHDNGSLPEGWKDIQDGFVDETGKFLNKAQAIETLEKAIKLPKLRVKRYKEITLPVGSLKQDHNGNKVKVQHGDGKESWVEVNSGVVAATDDRHAPPVWGANSHPASSRNPGAH
ncbi:hypothetical protein UFOVP75_69 [uncultured Caudovirales phage]|uniref:Uncharacterized protein n=1 Tax=uncultured Caudovirales phage TaxID=2100421 RepID=A0A6J5L1I5_9CAUD|nr:hypothetical protein UFOVP75_69 [uncultured Caudovirales phage]